MKPEVSIQDLLDRVKREGVAEANRKSQEILDRARLEAGTIVKEAKAEAETMLATAREEIQRKQEAFTRELSQAAGNLVLALREEIIRLLDHIVRRQVQVSLTPEVIGGLIEKVVDGWKMTEGTQSLEVLLSEEDCRILQEGMLQALGDRLKKGIVLKPVQGVASGFRIGERGGGMHYDFTDAGIAEVLSEYLNPRVAKLLAGVAGEEKGET